MHVHPGLCEVFFNMQDLLAPVAHYSVIDFLHYTFLNFWICVDSDTVVRNRTEGSHVLFTHFPPNILQNCMKYYAQNTDIDRQNEKHFYHCKNTHYPLFPTSLNLC